MSIIDLKTNLKSLRYGADKPYITKDINTTKPTPGRVNQIGKRVDDLERISKMFIDKPGFRYLASEALLKQTDLASKVNNLTKNPLNAIVDILKGVTKAAASLPRIVASTLAQVPVNGTGTHFLRGFTQNRYLDQFGTEVLLQTRFVKDSKSINTVKNNPVTIQSGSVQRQLVDFRKGTTSTYSFDYSGNKVNRETRVNLGNQGGRKNRTNYNTAAEPGTKDLINSLPPLQGEYGIENLDIYRDFIKFRFKVLTPDNPEGVTLYFRALLDSLGDSYIGDWSTQKYIGRAENFYIYGGFDRTINFSFKVAVMTRDEMKPIYQKIVYLASTTAPTYSDNFMKGTMIQLTIGDYIYGTPGIMTNIAYSWERDYPWEIGFQGPEETGDQDVQELPHVLNVTCTFKPIHDFVPQTGYYHFITNPNPGKSQYFTQGQTPGLPSVGKALANPAGIAQPQPIISKASDITTSTLNGQQV